MAATAEYAGARREAVGGLERQREVPEGPFVSEACSVAHLFADR